MWRPLEHTAELISTLSKCPLTVVLLTVRAASLLLSALQGPDPGYLVQKLSPYLQSKSIAPPNLTASFYFVYLDGDPDFILS